jgi:hypothetical protein
MQGGFVRGVLVPCSRRCWPPDQQLNPKSVFALIPKSPNRHRRRKFLILTHHILAAYDDSAALVEF